LDSYGDVAPEITAYYSDELKATVIKPSLYDDKWRAPKPKPTLAVADKLTGSRNFA